MLDKCLAGFSEALLFTMAVLCWGRRRYRRLDRLTMPLVGSGGGSEDSTGPTFGRNMWIHPSFCMIFLTKGYHVFCFFHISWQDVGSGKAFGHPGIPR